MNIFDQCHNIEKKNLIIHGNQLLREIIINNIKYVIYN